MSIAAAPARGLLDTNTVILLEHFDPSALPTEPLISAVTLAELSAGPLLASNDTERAGRQARLQRAEADFDAVPFDADAARAFGGVASALRKQGRKVAARAYDAMIAATALARDLPLYTCNPNDFRSIPGLTVIALEHPGNP